MTQRGIAPGLLLAMPQLEDPNFERSVVLMVEHSDEGSWGLIMNRPSDIPVSDILSSLGISWAGDPEAVVWSGGPVQPRTGWLVHRPVPGGTEETIEVTSGIALTTSPDRLRVLALEPPRQVRFLMGYSGWGSGQLETELASGAWVNAEATPDLIFETPAEEMWERALRSLGIDPLTLVPARGIH
jgi:putative transcriptional regulator